MCPTAREEKEIMTKVSYSSDIGSPMYAMVCTRSNIANTVGVVSRFLENLGKDHSEAMKWILLYLMGSSDECLFCGASNPIFKGYKDTDMESDLNNRKSIAGYVYFFMGSYIMAVKVAEVCCTIYN